MEEDLPRVPEAPDREIAKLAESLRLCRMELAALREDQEVWMEQRSRLRRRRALAEKRAQVLSVALAERFAAESAASPSKRLVRAVRRRAGTGVSQLTHEEQLSIIRSSSLFRPAYYLRMNLDVVEGGWDPAVHYLETGAAEGRKPGPDFDSTAYLEAHPELADSGVNPLVHYLLSRAGRSAVRAIDL
jgi:hypothetical protein